MEFCCVRMSHREVSTFQRLIGLSSTIPQMIRMIIFTESVGLVVVPMAAARPCSSCCSMRLASFASSSRRRSNPMSLSSHWANLQIFRTNSWSLWTRITTWTLQLRMATAVICNRMLLTANVISSTLTCLIWQPLRSLLACQRPHASTCTSRRMEPMPGRANFGTSSALKQTRASTKRVVTPKTKTTKVVKLCTDGSLGSLS